MRDKLEDRLNELIEMKNNIENEIKLVKQQINERKKQIRVDKSNPKLFQYYLVEIKGLKQSSYNHYCSSLDDMKKLLFEKYKISYDYNFIELDDPILFQKIIEMFRNDADLVNENRKRHHDISAAYNNYYEFLLSKR